MPLYKYNAVNSKGEAIEGTYSTGDRTTLLAMIREKEYHPVKIEELVERKDSDVLAFMQKVKLKDLAIFCRQFYTMLNAGVTIIKALDILQHQTENKKFKNVIGKVYEEVQKGSALSEALKKNNEVFPELLINMVEAGELSGSLDSIMDRMANHFEKENKLKNKVKSALIYPLILSIVTVAVVVFLLTFVMPTFFSMFEGSDIEIPLPTRILLGLSNFLVGYWYIVLAVVIGTVYAIRKYIKSEKGEMAWDRLKLRLPVVKGTMTKIITARFTRTLSTLLSSGIPLLQAMEVVARIIGNRVAQDGVMNAREEMRRGMDLATPIKRSGVFPPMVDSMIRIGEESGTLDDILDKTANFYDEEVDVAMQRMVSLMEPLMIVVMAGIVGFIVISMVLPMFDMLKTVDSK